MLQTPDEDTIIGYSGGNAVDGFYAFAEEQMELGADGRRIYWFTSEEGDFVRYLMTREELKGRAKKFSDRELAIRDMRNRRLSDLQGNTQSLICKGDPGAAPGGSTDKGG